MKKSGRYLAAYGSSFLISLIGIVWRNHAPDQTVLIILTALSAVPFLLLAANIILSKQYVKKINRTKVADMQGYMLRYRNEAEKASRTLLKRLQGQRRAAMVYAALVWFLAACASILGGMLYSFAFLLFYLCILYAGTMFYGIYARIPKKETAVLNDNALVLQRKEYPYLYDIARRAAQSLNCYGEITILLSFDCNAIIVRAKDTYYLQLGIILLGILSEEELYCTCLHEFSHCSDRNRGDEREMKYGGWLSSYKDTSGFMIFVTNLFAFFDARYLFDHMTYQYATSVVKETEADRDMAKYGSIEAAASVLLKLNYDNKFRWESGVWNEAPVYASEEPNPHYLRDLINRFKDATAERHTVWDEMIDREILSNSATHPTIKMRLETIGAERVGQIEGKSSPDYFGEVQKALDFADGKLLGMQDGYQKDREEHYLAPLRRVTEWEERGMPITAEGYADMISDLRQIGRNEEAEALCERAIQELNENSRQHAYFMKGCALIHRYDEAGVDLIYHAIENNPNYLEEGLQAIGEFYCMTGREEQLLAYRERAQQLVQKDKDEYSETRILSKNDKLSAEHMPDGMLEDILAYIRSVDEDTVQCIFLVRKTISKTFFTSVFVIGFCGGTDRRRDAAIMYKIFRYLDTYPVKWHFSLFNYFDCPGIRFDKIAGSLVYSKSNTKAKENENSKK